MRQLILVSVLAALGSACQSTKRAESSAVNRPQKTVTATVLPAPGERTTVRPVQAVTGRVIAVRDALRFVIVDFSGGKMPKLEQRLSVYSLDQKVAEIKISGPYLGTTVAADVVAGEAHENDLVREQ